MQEIDKAASLPILTLPLPGNGGEKLVFMPIPLQPTGDLAFAGLKKIAFSANNILAGYATKDRPERVLAGSFNLEVQGQQKWYYYLGKTEITRAQWRSVAPLIGLQDGPEDPKAGDPNQPQTGISAMRIEAFINAYAAWILQHHRELLPGPVSSTIEIGLPTSDQWEFAAAGGDAVPISRFQAPHPYPPEEPLDEYEVFNRRAAMLVGMMKPNPLGLYDMLGNVREMVGGRLNMGGQQGGMIIRGGDFRTQKGSISTSLTDEFPRYKDNKANTSDTVGFRLAITTGSLFPDDKSLRKWQKIQQKLTADAPKRDLDPGAPAPPNHGFQDASRIRELRAAADAGDPDKALELARLYEEQLLDDLRAKKYYDLAAANGRSEGYLASLRILRKRYADVGSAEILVEEGRLLLQPLKLDVTQNTNPALLRDGERARQREAFLKFDQAAKRGLALGRMEMARCRWSGIGTPIDPKHARRDLEDIRKDFPDLAGLDELLEEYDGLIAAAKDFLAGRPRAGLEFSTVRPALKWIAQTDPSSYLGHVIQYANQKELKENVKTALYQSFKALADAPPPSVPDPDAAVEVGCALSWGCGAEKKDLSAAIDYFQRAQDLGNYAGVTLMAYIRLGFTWPLNRTSMESDVGMRLMEAAAKNEESNALMRLAVLYQSGVLRHPKLPDEPPLVSRPRDMDLAIHYAGQAAARGYPEACFFLGQLFWFPQSSGDLLIEKRRNIYQALKWYDRGAELGHSECAERRDALWTQIGNSLRPSKGIPNGGHR